MKKSKLSADINQNKKKNVDVITIAAIVGMYGLFAVAINMSASTLAPNIISANAIGINIIAILIATFAMNITFTSWHEASHGLISKDGKLNDMFGILGSIPLGFPGYYGRKREHLIHHRYEADEKLDPVFPRIQMKFWDYLRVAVAPKSKLNPLMNTRSYDKIGQKVMNLTSDERKIDRVLLISTGIIGITWCIISPLTLLTVFLIPRFAIFVIHAYYICFLSHKPKKIKDADYVLYYCFSNNIITRFLTLNQSLHGFHHKYPNKKWYTYHKIKTEGIVYRESAENKELVRQ